MNLRFNLTKYLKSVFSRRGATLKGSIDDLIRVGLIPYHKSKFSFNFITLAHASFYGFRCT